MLRSSLLLISALVSLALNIALVGGVLRARAADDVLQRGHSATAAVHALVASVSEVEANLIAYVARRDAAFLQLFEQTADALADRMTQLETFALDEDPEHLRHDLLTASRAHLALLSRMRDHARTAQDMPPELLVAARRERQLVQAAAVRLIHHEGERLVATGSRARVLQNWLIAVAGSAAFAAFVSAVIGSRRANGSGSAGQPVETRHAVPEPLPSQSSAESPAAGDPVSVLIVDDDRHIRDLVQRWLKPHGFELRQAVDAQSALAAVVEREPAVLVCDIHMPGRNGLWLADQVRGRAPNCAIILATGDDTVPPFESFKPGVVGYVLKPFRREQLLAAVREGIRWSAQVGLVRAANPAEPFDLLELP